MKIGSKHSKKTRLQMSTSAKRAKNSGRWPIGSKPWNKGKTLPAELRLRISKSLENQKQSRSTRNKRRLSSVGRTQLNTVQLAYAKILKEIPELERQGFRCIPIGKIIPDIVAIKDGKIYAIEVEYSRRPKYSKYDGQSIFDDVMWILRHPYAK